MRVDYQVTKVTEDSGSFDTSSEDGIDCPMCGRSSFTVFVHDEDYIDLVCQQCHSLIHITGIEGK